MKTQEEVLGHRVRAKHPDDGKYYPGRVIKLTNEKAKVRWDDGDPASYVAVGDLKLRSGARSRKTG